MPLIAPPALSPRESAAVSYLRAAAFLSIVACHYLQAYHCAAAWVMNIGVQVFLCLSGYLYGHKVVAHPVQWLRRRVRKLYVPYALMVVATLAALVLLTDIRPTLTAVVNYTLCLQGLKGGVPHSGLEHLWFLTAILLCYLATPFLQWLRGRFTPRFSGIHTYRCVAVRRAALLPFCFSWFYLYALGYLFPLSRLACGVVSTRRCCLVRWRCRSASVGRKCSTMTACPTVCFTTFGAAPSSFAAYPLRRAS